MDETTESNAEFSRCEGLAVTLKKILFKYFYENEGMDPFG